MARFGQRRSLEQVLFLAIVTAMNVFGSYSVLGAFASMLELGRQGIPVSVIIASLLIWPIELWVSSIFASQWLARTERFNLAVLIAFLPVLAVLATKAVNSRWI